MLCSNCYAQIYNTSELTHSGQWIEVHVTGVRSAQLVQPGRAGQTLLEAAAARALTVIFVLLDASVAGPHDSGHRCSSSASFVPCRHPKRSDLLAIYAPADGYRLSKAPVKWLALGQVRSASTKLAALPLRSRVLLYQC